jgi:hypothetical protein
VLEKEIPIPRLDNSVYQYGVNVGPSVDSFQTRLSQIFGPKVDRVQSGVHIDTCVDRTQVIGLTRAKGVDHVDDNGVDTLILGQELNKLSKDLDIKGLVDAAVLQAKGAGARTYQTDGVLFTQDALNDAFDPQASGFIGVYDDTNANRQYAVFRINGVWYQAELTQV